MAPQATCGGGASPPPPPVLADVAARAGWCFEASYPEFDLDAVTELRARDYARIDAMDHVYLDYTGASLYAESQVREHYSLLVTRVLGNPHSSNPSSAASTAFANDARRAVLRFFHASPDDYDVVFTANATGALKILGEAYPFDPGAELLLSTDNHNSVNGIREFARRRGAAVRYLPLTTPDLRLDEAAVAEALRRPDVGRPRLFGYPAQSNYSGVQHPLGLIPVAQAHGWDVVLDAAAFAPTNPLDIDRWKPDFVSLSFYKLFGYPTGIGCLIARHEALARLRRPWFSGGTIRIVGVRLERHVLADGRDGFEDGTIDYLGLPAVEIGLRHLESVGIDVLSTRTRALTGWLLRRLEPLRHSTGSPMVRIYGPTTTERRGGTVAWNLLTPDGSAVDHRIVDAAATARRISLRTGCFCNPGASETARGITASDLETLFASERQPAIDDVRRLLPGRAAGAVRVSVGIASTPLDVDRFVRFVAELGEELALQPEKNRGRSPRLLSRIASKSAAAIP